MLCHGKGHLAEAIKKENTNKKIKIKKEQQQQQKTLHKLFCFALKVTSVKKKQKTKL